MYRIIQGDCREALVGMSGVTLFCTSPPYAQGLEYEEGLDWDGLYILMNDVARLSYEATVDSGWFL